MRSPATRAFHLLRATVTEWWQDDALRLGAALAYYTLFSLAPLLVVAIAVAGAFFGEEAARGSIVGELRGLMGPTGAAAIEGVIERASLQPDQSRAASLLAAATALFGASGAFGELQYALNRIWDAKPPTQRGLWRFLRRRLLCFAMVLLIGFLLLVSLVVGAAIAALDDLLAGADPVQPVLGTFQLAASLGIETLLFAAIYKVLPDVEIRWADVWVGALATALLFEVGKSAIGLYLGNSSISSLYGAAGSLVVVLVWVYYSSQILFLGAEFTQVWARRRAGARVAEPALARA